MEDRWDTDLHERVTVPLGSPDKRRFDECGFDGPRGHVRRTGLDEDRSRHTSAPDHDHRSGEKDSVPSCLSPRRGDQRPDPQLQRQRLSGSSAIHLAIYTPPPTPVPCEPGQATFARTGPSCPASLPFVSEAAKPETRPLYEAERDLLDHLLAPDFTGVGALRAQAALAQVIVQEEFPWFIELYVPPSAPPAVDVYRNPVTDAFTVEEFGWGAHVSLWLDGVAAAPGDYLARIEVMWMEDVWPALPTGSQLYPASVVK